MNILEQNNKIGSWYYFFGVRPDIMINRISWGYSKCNGRGKIIGLA